MRKLVSETTEEPYINVIPRSTRLNDEVGQEATRNLAFLNYIKKVISRCAESLTTELYFTQKDKSQLPLYGIRYSRTIFQIVLFFSALLGVAGCSQDEEITQQKIIEPNLSSIQAIIFTNCALQSCHGSSAKAGLNLLSGMSYEQLVNVRSLEDNKNSPPFFRVKPNSPDSSFLYIKITNPGKDQGERMPQASNPLSQTEIDAIRQWILDGAKNN